jgi:hypothetical protein
VNECKRYLLYFPEENPKQLDQDEIIEILDQAKARDPEWHEAMVNANVDLFELSYEKSVSHLKSLNQNHLPVIIVSKPSKNFKDCNR